MSVPVKMEFRHFLRYLVSGLLTIFLYYPYLQNLIPFWNQLDPTGKLVISLLFILFAGVVIDAITTASSGPAVNLLFKTRSYLKLVWQRFRHRERRRPETPTKFELLIFATKEERDLMLNEASAGYMCGSCTIVILGYLLNQLLYPYLPELPNLPSLNLIQLTILILAVIAFILVGRIHYLNYCGYREAIKKGCAQHRPTTRQHGVRRVNRNP